MINKTKASPTALPKPIEKCLPLFDAIVESVLEGEKESYQSDLLPFEQHSELVREQVHQCEKAYLERMAKAVKLLEKRFGKSEKFLAFLKV